MNVVDDAINKLISDCSLLERQLSDVAEKELVSSLQPDWPIILCSLTSCSRTLSEMTSSKMHSVLNSIILCPNEIPANREHIPLLLSVADDVDAEKRRSQALADCMEHSESKNRMTQVSTNNSNEEDEKEASTSGNLPASVNADASDDRYSNPVIEDILSANFDSTNDMENYVHTEVVDKFNATMSSQSQYFSRVRARSMKIDNGGAVNKMKMIR